VYNNRERRVRRSYRYMYKQVWRVNKESSNPSTRKQNEEDKREESQQDQKRERWETGRKKKTNPEI
jgi:hypothetical protein